MEAGERILVGLPLDEEETGTVQTGGNIKSVGIFLPAFWTTSAKFIAQVTPIVIFIIECNRGVVVTPLVAPLVAGHIDLFHIALIGYNSLDNAYKGLLFHFGAFWGFIIRIISF